jgi:hypothetical protein
MVNNSLKSLSDDLLWEETRLEVQSELKSTLKVIAYLQEINLRRLHLRRGYASLHEYCVNVLKYSDGSADRRIKAMRLVEDIPETRASIETGRLNLTSASQLQRVFEAKRKTKKPMLKAEKLNLFYALENKPKREVEKVIAAVCPEVRTQTESQKYVSLNKIQKTLIISERLNEKIEKLKKLRAHENRDFITIFEELVDQELKRVDPAMGAGAKVSGTDLSKASPSRAKVSRTKLSGAKPARGKLSEAKIAGLAKIKPLKNSHGSASPAELVSGLDSSAELTNGLTSPAELANSLANTTMNQMPSRSRYVPRKIKSEVWKRSQGECAYIDLKTGKKCKSTYWLQIDHIIPFAKGGPTVLENLRLLSANHNQLEAINHFGKTETLF